MISVSITFMVESMEEVTEAMIPIANQLQTIMIPPVGHQYVKGMANEQGSTVHVKVELVPEVEANALRLHKTKRKELARH